MVSETAFQQSHLCEAPLHAVLYSTWSLFMASAGASGYAAFRQGYCRLEIPSSRVRIGMAPIPTIVHEPRASSS